MSAERVLLVEDNPGDARLVREALRDAGEGFELAIEETLAGALGRLGAGAADVVLLDLSLPDSAGLDTVTRLRAGAPAVPIVVLSGSDDRALAVEAVQRGAQDYLVKGRIDGDVLARAIRYSIARTRAESELARAHAELERRVEERTAALSRANSDRARLLGDEQAARRQAEAQSRVKDEFLATLSHELRSPLTPILGWVHLLRGGRLDEAATARALETVERQTNALARLIEDLLDVSRIITGKLRLDMRPVTMEPVLAAALDGVRLAADAKRIDVAQVLTPDLPPVVGDADRLRQVVWNLLANAVKFTPDGGRVEVRLDRAGGGGVRLRVADNGKGIAREFLPFVFDRFRQADHQPTRTHGGLGLGLSIVRHLVEAHGGTVTAASEGQDRGATFTVELPLASAVSVAAEAAAGGEMGPALSGLRVLVVEDEPDAREFIATALGLRGAEVEAVGSVEEALAALLGDAPIDVLVSDLAMPVEDGLALIRRVRALPGERARRIPAVALTAHARPDDRRRALGAGFQAHLAKPADPSELALVVATLAGRTGV